MKDKRRLEEFSESEIDEFIRQRPQEIIEHLESMSEVYIDAAYLAKRTDMFRYYHEQVVKRIKSLLIPVPEEKFDEFVAHWWRILKDYQSGKMAGQLTNLIKTMLKEYDNLREGKEE